MLRRQYIALKIVQSPKVSETVNVPTHLVVIYGLANEIECLGKKDGKQSHAPEQEERLPSFDGRLDALRPPGCSCVAPKCKTFACVTNPHLAAKHVSLTKCQIQQCDAVATADD